MKRKVECTLVVDHLASSAIDKVWYDAKNRELYARYKGSQSVSGYKDVSQLAVDKLLSAASIGQHFDRFIKKGGYAGINTDSVELVNPYETPKPKQPLFKTTAWGGQPAVPAQAKKARYKVSAVVLMPSLIEEEVVAESLEDAIVKFRDKYSSRDPKVEGVRKA